MPIKPPTFRPKGQPTRRHASAAHDAKRGSARQRGYDAKWDKEATAFKREFPLCLGCRAVGRFEASAVVDHVMPHKGDRHLMWDRRNWQPACRFHHDVVKQRLEVMFAQGKIGANELRLDSDAAMRLTRELLLEPGGG
jgi:5-methylcytosine-specific restriction enzyme A